MNTSQPPEARPGLGQYQAFACKLRPGAAGKLRRLLRGRSFHRWVLDQLDAVPDPGEPPSKVTSKLKRWG